MNLKICPMMGDGKECQYMDCALFVKTEQFGRCAIAVIAEEMRSSSAGTDLIADNLLELVKAVDKVVNTLKGMV